MMHRQKGESIATEDYGNGQIRDAGTVVEWEGS
jgi:hypothetical protein